MSERKVQTRSERAEDVRQLIDRVMAAAEKGGASQVDILALYYLLGRLTAIEEFVVPLAKERARQIVALERRNEGHEVTPDMRAQVIALDKELVAEFPFKSHRYEEIDRRKAWKRGRARYIIEGPRKSGKK